MPPLARTRGVVLTPPEFRLRQTQESGRKPRGLLVIAHQDDEVGFANTLRHSQASETPSLDWHVAYTTNSNGLAWGRSVAEQKEFGEKKARAAHQVLTELVGLPADHVHFLGMNEITAHNAFIMPGVMRHWKARGVLPSTLPADFQAVTDPAVPFFRGAQWIYRLLDHVDPDVVVTGDILWSIHMHDQTTRMTYAALNQRMTEGQALPDVWAFPQQLVRPGKLFGRIQRQRLYRYPPAEEASLPELHRTRLTKEEVQLKRAILAEYAREFPTDRWLFRGYMAQMMLLDNPAAPSHFLGNNYLRRVSSDEVTSPAMTPPEAYAGGMAAYGNREHYGVFYDHGSFRNTYRDLYAAMAARGEFEPGSIDATANAPFEKVVLGLPAFREVSEYFGNIHTRLNTAFPGPAT
jgi:LmbE family N-acetylglucosaminyl deacetylase